MHVFHGNTDARVGHERLIGHDMSGVVHALGESVEGLPVGTKVVVRAPLLLLTQLPVATA